MQSRCIDVASSSDSKGMKNFSHYQTPCIFFMSMKRDSMIHGHLVVLVKILNVVLYYSIDVEIFISVINKLDTNITLFFFHIVFSSLEKE